MQRKLAGYILLSFLSFMIFTTLFMTVANAQVSTTENNGPVVTPSPTPTPESISPAPQTAPALQVEPTVTPTPSAPPVKFTLQSVNTPTPTPDGPTPTPTKEQPAPTAEPTKVVQPSTKLLAPSPAVIPTTVPQPTVVPTQTSAVNTSEASPISEEALTYLGNCESGMDPARNSDNDYYGAFQFSYNSWKNLNTGYERADLAPLEVQKAAVRQLLQKSSIYTQFPACANKMHNAGLI
jgi:outer membrane biosynthesis protein TonB